MGKAAKTPSRSDRCKKYLGSKPKKDAKQKKKIVARARQAQYKKRKGSKSSGSNSTIDCSKFLNQKGNTRGGSLSSDRSGKCHKQGPVTRNPFFNFLRDYRKKHCGKSVVEIAREGAKEWRSMSEQQKEQYIKSACLAPKTKRKARRCSRKRERGTKRAKRHHSSSQASSSCTSTCSKTAMSRSRSISRTSTGPSTF